MPLGGGVRVEADGEKSSGGGGTGMMADKTMDAEAFTGQSKVLAGSSPDVPVTSAGQKVDDE